MAEQTSNSEIVAALAEEFVERYRQGERPPISEYVGKHPELADEIREVFPALVMIEGLAPEHDASIVGAEPESAPATPMVEQLGDYRILREIGRGGMGVVYEAEQVSLGRRVALKVLTQQMQKDSNQRQRFEREAKAAAKLHHTNIVPVFGVGEDNGTSYYVMQFIQGLGLDEVIHELRRMLKKTGSLQSAPQVVEKPSAPSDASAAAIAQSLATGEFHLPQESGAGEDPMADDRTADESAACEASTPFSGDFRMRSSSTASSVVLPGRATDSTTGRVPTYWHSVANIGIQIAEALHQAHEQGILHRDVKPSNLLLDVQGNVWVTDFGLAKLDDQQNITHTGDVLGTLRYMAPELFSGKADARSEVYSLGLTLFELLALKPAFDETDRNKLIKQVTSSEPPQLGKTAPAVPRDLATICQKCIETEPARRYQSAEALAEDLQRWLNGEPIKARPIGRFERAVRWCRRHPAVAGLLAAVVLVTLLGFAGVLWQWRDAVSASKFAEAARKTADEERDKARWLAYKASLRAASAALDNDNVILAEQSLHEAPPEHRGWEWLYFHNQRDTSFAVLQRGQEWDDADKVVDAALNPKGTVLATSQYDGSIRLWALPARKLIKVLPVEMRSGELTHLTLCFSPDGTRLIACGMKSKTLQVWDVETGAPIAALEHPTAISAAYFNPDGRILATLCNSEPTIRLWNSRSGELLRQVEAKPPHVFSDKTANTAVLGKGKLIAVPFQKSEMVYLLDIESGRQHDLLTAAREDCHYYAFGFSPDQSRLVSGAAWPDNSVSLWDVDSGKRLWKADGHQNSVYDVVVSPDGARVVSVSMDKTARIWDLKTGHSIAVLRGHSGALFDAVFSPDGSLLFTCSNDKTIRIWDARTGAALSTLRGHEQGIRNLEIDPYGEMLFSRAAGGKILCWNLDFLKRNVQAGHSSFVYDAAFSADGSRIFSAGWDKTLRQWDVATGRPLAVVDGLPHPAGGVAIHPSGRHLALVVANAVYVCDTSTGQIQHRLKLPTTYETTGARIQFHPDGSLLAGGSNDGNVYLWETENYRLVKTLVGKKDDFVIALCFDRIGTLLFSGSSNGMMCVWDVATGREVAAWQGHDFLIFSLVLSPDGKWLVSTSIDESVSIWDTSTRKRITTFRLGTRVYDAAFHPDQKRLALACRDQVIRLFSTEKWQEVAQLRGHKEYVHSVDFSQDGTRLVSASGDFDVRVWDTVSAKERAKEWTPVEKPNPRAAWHGREHVPPMQYLCYRAAKPLKIDGKLDDAAWMAVQWTEEFVDIEGDRKPKPRYKTRAKMLWDDDYFYVAAELQEPHVWGTLTKHDSIIYHDNDFEVFLDPDGDNHKYLEYEINPLGTGFDLFMPKPYKDGGKAEIPWNIVGLKRAVRVNGTLNDPSDTDKSWTVELAFPWKELGKKAEVRVPPKDGEQWRVNFSRVQWKHEIVNGKYKKIKGLPEDNWVWSPQHVINMHRPETWGYVQFTTAPIGKAKFVPDPTDRARMLMHRILYSQRAFQLEHKRWARNLTELGLDMLKPPTDVEAPSLRLDGEKLTITACVKPADGKTVTLSLHDDSRMEKRFQGP